MCWITVESKSGRYHAENDSKGVMDHLTRCVAVIGVLGACVAFLSSVSVPSRRDTTAESIRIDRDDQIAKGSVLTVNRKSLPELKRPKAAENIETDSPRSDRAFIHQRKEKELRTHE
jgi:hypothetical protein